MLHRLKNKFLFPPASIKLGRGGRQDILGEINNMIIKTKILKIIIGLIVLFFTTYITFAIEQTKLKFYQEEITVNCYENEIEVWATYHLNNASDSFLNAKIACPFPVDKLHSYPHDIFVEGYNYRTYNDSTIYWRMDFEPYEKKDVVVRYKQKIKGNSARYILLTTQKWNEPFEQVEYFINLPANWSNIELSYPYDKVEIIDGIKHYYIKKRNFMPEKDLIVHWKVGN